MEHVSELREGAKDAKTDIRSITPKLGKAKAELKKAQEASKNAALTGAEYTPEMEKAEQDAMNKVNELQKQLDDAKT